MQRALTALAATMVAGLPCSMAAAQPEALSRVPADAPLIVSISSVSGFFAQAEALTNAIDQADAAAGLGMASDMFQMPGIDPQGSAAIVFSSLEGLDDQPEPPVVALVPVTDYAQVVTNLGGTGQGLEIVQFEGEDVFIKDIGDGFAAIAPTRDLLEGFTPADDSGDDHEAAIGETGEDLLESSTIVVIADVASFAPAMLEGWQQASQQMAMFGQMAGQGDQIQQQIETMTTIIETFGRDGERGMLGLGADDNGISIELAASFKQGSEIAGFFQETGEATDLTEMLPGGPYLFAMAFDTSSEGIRQLLLNSAEMNPQGQIPGLNPAQFVEGSNGFAQVFGMNPVGLMGGLFVNTTAVMDVEDANGFIANLGDSLRAANGQQATGMTLTTNFADAPEQIEGAEAYRWSVKMLPDLNDPNAQQMQMMMPMLFGPSGGPNGYIAAADDETVVMTYSTSRDALSGALSAARTGGDLADNALFQAQTARLHDDAVAVAYIDVGSIMRAALPMVAMFADPVQIEVPDEVHPIAMSLAAEEGSMAFRTVVPQDVIELIISTAESLEGMNQGGGGGGGGEPQF
ncbi:MAG: hypothetical protein AAGB48_06955 [Planctomycetota bacterium]